MERNIFSPREVHDKYKEPYLATWSEILFAYTDAQGLSESQELLKLREQIPMKEPQNEDVFISALDTYQLQSDEEVDMSNDEKRPYLQILHEYRLAAIANLHGDRARFGDYMRGAEEYARQMGEMYLIRNVYSFFNREAPNLE